MADKEKTARVGRPRLPGSAKYIRLRESVFKLWRERKDILGKFTDSEFAEYLLHRRADGDPSPGEYELASHDLGSFAPLSSTPVRVVPRRQLPLDSPSLSNSNVDVTGVTLFGECSPMQSVQCQRANISFDTVDGNPFSVLREDRDINNGDDGNDAASAGSDNSTSSTENSTSSTDSFGVFSGDQHFTNRMHSVIEQLRSSDTDSDNSDDLDSGDEDDDYLDLRVNGAMQSHVLEFDNSDYTKLVCEDMEISVEDDERTITMVEDVVSMSKLSLPTLQPLPADEEAVIMDDLQAPQDCGIVIESAPNEEPSTSRKVIDNRVKLLLDLENSLAKVTNIGSELQEFAVLHERSRFIVSAEKLLELAGSNCTVETDGHVCSSLLTHETKSGGGNLELFLKCTNGHNRKWVSSEVLTQKRNQSIYLNDCLLPAAIIISGNNYEKFSLLCKALGLNVVGRNTFMRFQKHCAAPVVEELWMDMNKIVKKLFEEYEDVCLCGDGRNDSPGHSARYCVYTLMEQFTNIVVDFEVIDKRETGGSSTRMEKEALRRLLERMAIIFPFDEITTDASPTIIKLVRDLKEKFPQLMELFHSLDIWHKAKKLNKGLHQAANIKGCGELQEWIDCIVNHFWFCSQDCIGSIEELKETWCGVLHHVCGEHTWATGQCKHNPINDMASNKKYLEKGSKAMTALRKIVLDPKWLNTLHYYVRFRHTSVLESYNSMMTKYVPKRMAFEYPYFIMRVTLAAIDHNMHLSRTSKLTKAGKEQGHRKYSKRSQNFHAEIVKEEKCYSYFPFLVAKMLHRRSVYEGSFTLPSDRMNEFDPKQIAPTIGMKEPPPTEELMKGPSRFEKKLK